MCRLTSTEGAASINAQTGSRRNSPARRAVRTFMVSSLKLKTICGQTKSQRNTLKISLNGSITRPPDAIEFPRGIGRAISTPPYRPIRNFQEVLRTFLSNRRSVTCCLGSTPARSSFCLAPEAEAVTVYESATTSSHQLGPNPHFRGAAMGVLRLQL